MSDVVYALLSITFAQLAGQNRHRDVQLVFFLISHVRVLRSRNN